VRNSCGILSGQDAGVRKQCTLRCLLSARAGLKAKHNSLVLFLNHLFSIPFPRLALLVFFFGVVRTRGGKSSHKDDSDGITSVQLVVSWAICSEADEVDGSHGIDHDGRKRDEKAERRGVRLSSVGLSPLARVMLAMVSEL